MLSPLTTFVITDIKPVIRRNESLEDTMRVQNAWNAEHFEMVVRETLERGSP